MVYKKDIYPKQNLQNSTHSESGTAQDVPQSQTGGVLLLPTSRGSAKSPRYFTFDTSKVGKPTANDGGMLGVRRMWSLFPTPNLTTSIPCEHVAPGNRSLQVLLEDVGHHERVPEPQEVCNSLEWALYLPSGMGFNN